VKVLEQVVEQCFTSTKLRTQIPEDLRSSLPKVVRNSAQLINLYPARCEAVVIFSGNILQSKTLQELIKDCVELADTTMENLGYYSPSLIVAQPTINYKTKIKHWFLRFAGTIDRTVGLISRIVVARGAIEDDRSFQQTFDCFENLIDLFVGRLFCYLQFTYT
jgi:hypothetical protein